MFADTEPKVLEVWLEHQRRMSPAQKVSAVLGGANLVFRMEQAGIRSRDPGLSEREVFLRAAAMHLDRETMIRAYGWDPEGC